MPSRPKYYNLNSDVVRRSIKLQCTAQAEVVVGRKKKLRGNSENSCGSGCIQKKTGIYSFSAQILLIFNSTQSTVL